VLSDICMPEMDGLALLKAGRDRDCDLPVALITAQPEIDSAMAAVRLGAFQYVPKPVDPKNLLGITQKAARLYQSPKQHREASREMCTDLLKTGDRYELETALRDALSGLWMAYQPIVSWSRREV